jgi:FAD/FMN-containing dehydrogenase
MIAESALQAFRASLRGQLVLPKDAEYDSTRKIHNAMIDRRPAAIVRCAGVADVVAAVNFARQSDFLVAVRGAGHNIAGTSLCDGGLVIDLSRMKSIRVDAARRTVRVEGGATWADLNHELQVFGLAATGGYIGTTGVSGLTLGGGLGWMVRKHGLALDNLLSVDIVTADGQVLTASATENPDLFWGVRGGGGNFGVVTSFEFKAHMAGIVWAGLTMHPATRAANVLRFWREYECSAPEEVTNGALLFHPPAELPLPDVLHRDGIIGVGGVYCGSLDAGEKALRPLREFGPPTADTFDKIPYSQAQVMADFLWPAGQLNYWKSSYLKELSDAAIDTIVARFATVPSRRTIVVLEHNGDGAMSRVDENTTAFGHRRWPYNLLVTSIWGSPSESDANIRWTREFFDAMQPFLADAVYVNYLGDEGQERVRDAYGVKYERLVALKNTYDPTNFFRMNQNIRPTVRTP